MYVPSLEQLDSKMSEYHALTTQRIFYEINKRFTGNENSGYLKDLKDATMQYFGLGKGLRPAFLFLFNQLFSEIREEAVDLAASIELLHTSSLIHEDLMDRDRQRRGVETVWKKWGDVTAVLSGDYLMALAHHLAASRASELGEVFMDICLGQQMDTDFERREFMEVSTRSSLDMVHLKSSALFETACRWGASLGGATDQQIEMVSRYARLIAMAFQLQDNMLNLFGDPKINPVGSDLIRGKKNPLILYTLENGTEADREYLLKYLGTKMDGFTLGSCITIVERYGLGYVEEMRSTYIEEAVKTLQYLPDNDTRDMLASFARYCGERK